MSHETSVLYIALIKTKTYYYTLAMEVASITNACSSLITEKRRSTGFINEPSDASSNITKIASLSTVSFITVKKVNIPILVCSSNSVRNLQKDQFNLQTSRTGSSCVDISNRPTEQKHEESNINSIVKNTYNEDNPAIGTPTNCEKSQNVTVNMTATNVFTEENQSPKSSSVDSVADYVSSCPDVNNQTSNTEVTSFCCKVCKKVLATMLRLETHMKCQHNPDGSLFKCKECGKEFLYRCRFERHTHARLAERRMYPCEECGKKFVSKWTLQNHIDIHYGKNSYDCHLCDKRFRRKPTRDNHIRIDHQGILKDKHFLCTVCGKLFRTNYDLSHHFIKHTDQRPFKCKTCHKTFRNKRHMKDHENVHIGVKPYVCNVCGRKFLHSGNRIKHQRRHNKVRPHECRLCDSSFYEKQELERHFQKHHNDNTE